MQYFPNFIAVKHLHVHMAYKIYFLGLFHALLKTEKSRRVIASGVWAFSALHCAFYAENHRVQP